MHEAPAIRFEGVSKVYQLYGSQTDQLIHVLGLQRFGIRVKTKPREFAALRDIDLTIPKGHRLGIVGRNGAGKTTLLKLICGNIGATAGTVEVSGTVQALMTTGTGFHPDHTGRENIFGSLQYNGLEKKEYEEAFKGIVDFCELGEFLDQPLKTYSLGMQARLMFAVATAVKPNVLIVDEVLGAGDAYFVAKSKQRVAQLVGSGCTMLLVSHSMQQVLELCSEAIWLDQGTIRMQADSFSVVKAYEAYMHGQRPRGFGTMAIEVAGNEKTSEGRNSTSISAGKSHRQFQEPYFVPNVERADMMESETVTPDKLNFITKGGISRWDSDKGVKVVGFSILSQRGESNELTCLTPVKFVISIEAECCGTFSCRYGIVIHNHLGECMARVWSPIDKFEISEGCIRRIELLLNPLQIGPGEYVVGISVVGESAIEEIDAAVRYDLLGRSFEIKVSLPDSLNCVSAGFFHSGEWLFSSDTE